MPKKRVLTIKEAASLIDGLAKINLHHTYFVRMKQLTDRVYPPIGHLRLDKITGRRIQQFVNDLINSTSERTGKPLAAR